MSRHIVIRKETYGTIVFSPDKACFYEIKDTTLKDLLIKDPNFLSAVEKTKYANELQTLGVFSYPVRIIDNTNSNSFIPLEAYFDYTSKCNRTCRYCYNKDFINQTTMKPSIVQKVFNDFYDLGIMRVHLAGGEPTIDYDGIKNYIEYGNKKGMVISMATNGTLLDDKMCDLLTSNDLLSVSFSIDSASKEKNDERRGVGTFDKLISGVETLGRYKILNNSSVEICFKPVYSPSFTKQEAIDLIDLAISLGVEKVKFANPERCLFHEQRYYGKISSEYYNTSEMLQSVIDDYKLKIALTNITNPVFCNADIGIFENKGCIGAQELITINPDGRITPCLMNHTLLGNYYDYESLSRFLDTSKELKEYRKSIITKSCFSCQSYKQCRGGCQVRKIVEFGKIQGIDPLCPIKMVQHKIKQTNVIKNEAIKRINVFHSL